MTKKRNPRRSERNRRPRLGLERLEDRIAPAIAIEDFTGYAVGPLTGQSGGLGWRGAWVLSTDAAAAPAQVDTATTIGTVNTAASVAPVAGVKLAPGGTETRMQRPLAPV